jgi:hypothetical protein
MRRRRLVAFPGPSRIPLEKWGEVFESQSVARAAADRLTDRGHLLETTADSYWKPGRNAVVSPQFRTC